MRGEFCGLQIALILEENTYAHYICCFAHQLQLVVVEVVFFIKDFFNTLAWLSILLMINVKCMIIGVIKLHLMIIG